MSEYTTEELKEHRAKWVEALRSGKYEQTDGVLRDKEATGYCCLGVACEISEVGEWGIELNTTSDHDEAHYDGKFRLLPLSVAEWLGIATDHGYYRDGLDPKSLTEINDRGFSFQKIADIIESAPPGLFQKECVSV